MGTELIIAPGAGSGLGKQLAAEWLADPDFAREIAQGWRECMQATRTYYDKAAGGNVTEPDYRVRLQAIMGAVAHIEGEPIKRVIHEHTGPTGLDTLAAMQDSPALLEAVKREVAKAEFRTRNKKRERVATTVEVEE